MYMDLVRKGWNSFEIAQNYFNFCLVEDCVSDETVQRLTDGLKSVKDHLQECHPEIETTQMFICAMMNLNESKIFDDFLGKQNV